jgi:dTMP kinase
MFIILEGPDGVGKTAQAKRLAERLRGDGHNVLRLAFPTDSPTGRAARLCVRAHWREVTSDPRFQAIVMQSVMVADRYGAVAMIRSALHVGGMVIADRWTPSGTIYGSVDGLDGGWIADTQALLPKADLYLLLDASIDTICTRLQARGAAPGRYENRQFQDRVRSQYQALWALHAHDGWKVVNADRTEVEMHAEIWQHVISKYHTERR